MKRKVRKPTIENLAIQLRDVWVKPEFETEGATPLTMAGWFDIPASNRRRWRAVARYCLNNLPS